MNTTSSIIFNPDNVSGFINFTHPGGSEGKVFFCGAIAARERLKELYECKDITLAERDEHLKKINTSLIPNDPPISPQNAKAVKLLQDTVQGENGIFVKFKNAYLLRQRN